MQPLEILAIIPARGGSKGIKKKNLLEFCEISLLGRAIRNAQKCKLVSRIIVSTDSNEIAHEALRHEAEVPFMRPKELSGDHSETIDTFIHALDWLRENEQYVPDAVMCLQCTSPFVQPKDLYNGTQILVDHDAQAVFSVCETAHHPLMMGKINTDGTWEHLLEHPYETCRQKLDKVYQHNGAIYIVKTEVILTQKTWFPAKTYPYVMDRNLSIDIDTPEDVNYLNFLFQDDKFKAIYKTTG